MDTVHHLPLNNVASEKQLNHRFR